MSGPLHGLDVLELEAIGPIPLAGMILSDLGATVVRIDRPPDRNRRRLVDRSRDFVNRGRRSVVLDLRSDAGRDALLRLVKDADMLLEGHRPGVMERLGLGPDDLLRVNRRLIYGRMTGWGQDGAYAQQAAHDVNYAAVAGALHATGYADRPPLPALNLVADYGGGAMLLLVGVLAALHERTRSGLGQVVDAAMVDGVALLVSPILSLLQQHAWSRERQANLLDGGAHFYNVYETRDNRYVSVGAIEPQFYAELLDRLELDEADWPQMNRERWPELRGRLAAVFALRTAAEWKTLFAGTDACVFVANTFDDLLDDPHLASRATFVDGAGGLQPAPAPRFSRTPGAIQGPPPPVGEHTADVLGASAASRRRRPSRPGDR